jgi:GNAT superfamily N-acetyltransferase
VSRVEIVSYAPEHEDAVVSLVTDQAPGSTPEAIRHELTDEARCRVRLVATDGGAVVGVGDVLHQPWLDDRHLTVLVRVDEQRRGAGVGRALHRRLAPNLPGGVTQISTIADDDARSLRIAEHWGFSVYQHAVQSELRLARTAGDLPSRDDIVFVRHDDVRALVDPELDRLLDEADTSPEAQTTGTNGLAAFTGFPDPFAVVARVDGEAAAITIAMQSQAHAHVLITATHPRFRRIGLAEAIKRQLHEFGASRGVERFTTVNEASNEAIRRLNAALGYRRISGTFRVRRSP